ncbi:MAG: IS21 family transposase [Vicinamibacteria bacterium]
MRHDRRRLLAYEVQRLDRAGRSQREIASALGIARRTVRSLLNELRARRAQGDDALERELGPRAPKPSLLDSYDDKIREWLERWPDLTAVRCHEKLLDETTFRGGYTVVRERVRLLRAELRPPRSPSTPVETAPGQRAEFDWSPYTLDDGTKVNLWHAALRWSRAPYLAASNNYRQTTTLRMLRESFESWKGVPAEAMTDSMPGVVDRWECDEPVLNVRYVDFAAFYGYTALIAPRGCPTWKAVAERRFRHHEENCLNGRDVANPAEYAELIDWWQREKVFGRPHPEQQRPIGEVLELERAHLQPLPARPYDTRDVVVRVVDDYQRVRLDTNHYPVRAPVGARVYVCADAERVVICDAQARRVGEHERLPAGARVKLEPESAKRVRYDVDELVARVGAWGEGAAVFAARVRERRRCAGAELVRVLQLQVSWSLDDLVEAMQHATSYGCYEVTKLQRILEARFTPRRFEEQIAEASRERIQGVMKQHPVSLRPLTAYDALSRGDRALSSDVGNDSPPPSPENHETESSS